MKEFKTLEIKQSVFADNDKRADELREELTILMIVKIVWMTIRKIWKI